MESRFVLPHEVPAYQAEGWRVVADETIMILGQRHQLIERQRPSPLRWAALAAAGRLVTWCGRMLVLVAELTGGPGRLCLKAGGRLAARAVELRAGRRFG